MKRTSPVYVTYLENLVEDLLHEREQGGKDAFISVRGKGREFLPVIVQKVIEETKAQVAVIQWAGDVGGHGFGVRVPESFARQAGRGSWVKVQGKWDVEVREGVKTPEGPCLILSTAFVVVVDRSIEAGMSISLD